MADEKAGKKPDQEGGGGAEKEDASEVGGRRRTLLYTCFNDGAGNYVSAVGVGSCWRLRRAELM